MFRELSKENVFEMVSGEYELVTAGELASYLKVPVSHIKKLYQKGKRIDVVDSTTLIKISDISEGLRNSVGGFKVKKWEFVSASEIEENDMPF